MLFRLCHFLVGALVEHPDAIKIDRIETERVDILFVHVAADDRGRVLGKGGRTIGALRGFLEAIAEGLGREVVIEIVE